MSETWWGQTAEKYGINVLVNNSAGGSRTKIGETDITRPSGIERCVNIHKDTVTPVVNPDIIAVFMGTNDFLAWVEVGTYSESLHSSLVTDNGDGRYTYATPTTFVESYIIMMDKIVKQYKNADVFCFTLIEGSVWQGQYWLAYRDSPYKLKQYCDVIKQVAAYYGAEVVDLYTESGITMYNVANLTHDHVHPNALGMDAISKVFEKALLRKYFGCK